MPIRTENATCMRTMESLFLSGHMRIAGAIAAALLFVACTEDPTAEAGLRGGSLRFEVTEADTWQIRSQSRTAEDSLQTKECAAVFTLQGETPADTLFLHAVVSDKVDAEHIGPTAPKPEPLLSRWRTFTIRSVSWLRFIRVHGAKPRVCRIICTTSR